MSDKRKRVHRGSLFDRMSQLEVGGSVWVEAESPDQAVGIQRQASTVSRYPAVMQDCQYTTSVFTAVGRPMMQEIHLLVRIERLT